MYGPPTKDDPGSAILISLIGVFTLASVLALVFALSGCTIAPDGRRVLTPGAQAVGGAVLQDVLACGAPLLLGALSGQQLNYIEASACHLQRVGERLGRTIESAPAPSEEHGRDVLRTAVLEHQGDHREAQLLAGECEATARAKLEGGAP